MADAKCKPCAEKGRDQLAHRIVKGVPMCDWCFRGEKHPKEIIQIRDTKLVSQGKMTLQTEEMKMSRKTDEATAAEIRKDFQGGMGINAIATKHDLAWGTVKTIVAGMPKPAGAKRGRPAKAKTSNGAATLIATPELCDAIWTGLPLEKKAALLNRLPEIR